MKIILALILSACLLLSGCTTSQNIESSKNTEELNSMTEEETTKKESVDDVEFAGLSDAELTEYLQETVYKDVIDDLNSEDYLVENVSATYISKEYLNELEYNSQSNVYFGFTLPELEQELGDEKYVFTCDENGKTIIASYEEYDDTYDQVIKNVAIGSGVILLCATVSVVSGGAGAPAVSMIFAMSAKTGTTVALSSGFISGTIAATVTGYQTKNVEKTLKSTALAASDGFKWGAITGSLTGGISQASALKGATLNGLTMNEAAAIQKESGYSIDIIKQFHSTEEYNIYKNAGLYSKNVNGNMALVRDIDLDYVSEFPDGTTGTNLERMAKGYAPMDPSTEKVFQLHHIGQKSDGSLAILNEAEHQGNASILNIAGKSSEIDRTAFEKTKKTFWKAMAESYQ